MNKNFYSFKLLLAALCVMLYSHVQVLAQSCPPANRTVSNCKTANPNDAIGAVIKNLIKNNGIDEGIDKAAWLFESGGSFVENGDGTADLTAVICQYPLPSNRKFQVQVRFTNQTYTAPADSPMLTNYLLAGLTANTQGWYYYDWGTATLTGLGDLAGAKLNLFKRDKAAQVGIGGADQVTDINNFSVSAWFSWQVEAQPTNTSITLNPFPANPSTDQGDFCFALSGTPTVCTPTTGCIDFKGYCDLNGDNLFQTTEPGVAGLTISLVNSDFSAVAGFSNLTVNANGELKLNNVPAGNYFITVPINTTINGKVLNAPQQAVAVNVAGGTICSAAFAGYTAPPAPATGCIDFKGYCDLNGDKIFQTTEPGVTGLTISLVNPDFSAVAGFSNLAVNANGELKLDNVPAGNYFITVPITTTISGKVLNAPQQAVAVTVVGGAICSTAFAGYTAPPAPPTGSVSGKAYCDDNNNGLDATDKPAKSVLVTLCDANAVQIGTPLSTDDNGNYTFSNLSAGSYQVKFSATAVIGADTKPIITAPVISVTLTAGENRTGINAGYYKPIDPCATDIAPPTFVKFCPTDISETTTTDCKAITWVAPTATDNCSTPSVSSNFNSGFCFSVGTTTVTYTAKDAKNNTTSCSFTVKVTKTVNCGSISGNTISASCANGFPALNGNALAGFEYQWLSSTSSCPTLSSQAIVGATGQNLNLTKNVTTTTYYVRCARPIGCTVWGRINESNCITIKTSDCDPCANDIAAPAIACPSNIVKDVTGMAGTCWNISYANATATDNCSTPKIVCTSGLASGACFPEGVSNINFKATDAKGNSSTCNFTVTIKRTTPVCNTIFSTTKCYRIVNVNSGKTLDVSGGGTNNDTKIIQWGYHGGTNQQVRLYPLGSGLFKILFRNSGKVLANHDTKNGSDCYLYDYYSGGFKDWKIECNSDGTYKITHRASGRVLDVKGDSKNDGAVVEIKTWDNTNSQKWRIEEVACNTSSTRLATSSVFTMNATAEPNRTRIEWVNNTSYKNDFFSVQRLNNNSGDFEDLETINATEEVSELQYLTSYDNAPLEGDNYYRVKVAYNDGTFSYTETKKVNFNQLSQVRLYPNPTSEFVNLDLSEFKGKDVNIFMYNQFGQQVQFKNVQNVGDSPVMLNVLDYTPGNFLIRVTTQGKRDVTKQVTITK